MTTLYRRRADLDLATALASLPHDAVVVAETPAERPTVGLWLVERGQLVDVAADGARGGDAVGRLRHRTAAELAAGGVYAVRAFTQALDLHWRGPGLAVWLSERPFTVDVPAAVDAPVTAAEQVERLVLRRGQPVRHEPLPGWSAWGDAEVGVLWYPVELVAPPAGPANPIVVARVVDYAYEVTEGPAAGCVAPLTTRWVSWEVVDRSQVQRHVGGEST